MALFEPVSITWKGVEYSIPPNRTLRALAKIEEVVTLNQLRDPEAVPMAKLSMAYGSLLRFAGAPATDDEVYEMMWTSGDATPAHVVNTLLLIMLPKSVRDKMVKAAEPEQDEGNVAAATPEAKASSNRRMRR